MTRSTQNNKLELLAVSAVLLLSVFIFNPIVIYITNVEQLTTPLYSIIVLNLAPVLVLFLLMFIGAKFMPGEYQQRVAVLLAILSILVWFQGNVLVWEYGILDGRSIDWSDHGWRGWVDATIWAVAIVSTFVFYRKAGDFVIKGAFFIFLVQAVYIGQMSYENWNLIKKDDYKSYGNSEEIFEFSNQQNILHIVSDGFQADVFEELLQNEKPNSNYQNVFQGFVFYRETLGAFPYTRFALPAFLAGELYTNDTPKDEYVDDILNGDTIINAAQKAGYEIDIGTPGAYLKNRYVNLPFDNLFNLTSIGRTGERFEDAATVMDLALFRISPHIFKKYIYNDQRWLLSQLAVSDRIFQFIYFRHTYFLNLLAEIMSVERERPVYKYIHIKNTHNPIIVDEECRYTGRPTRMNRRTLTIQSRCTLDTLSKVFNRMKELGIYDSTLIILHADHGGWAPNYRQGPPVVFKSGVAAPDWLTSLASPLLAIKQPHDSQGFRISDVHASLLDIPATIADINNWETEFRHESVLDIEEGEPRERVFRFYFWQRDAWETDFTGPIQEFIIQGSHYETEWMPGQIFHPPGKGASTK